MAGEAMKAGHVSPGAFSANDNFENFPIQSDQSILLGWEVSVTPLAKEQLLESLNRVQKYEGDFKTTITISAMTFGMVKYIRTTFIAVGPSGLVTLKARNEDGDFIYCQGILQKPRFNKSYGNVGYEQVEYDFVGGKQVT